MTDPTQPASPSRPTSTAVFVATLQWGSIVTGALAVVAAIVGYLIGGEPGLWSALSGVLLAFVFLAITALSILIANRWFGDALYVPIFFGIVLGGWIVKFGLFIVLMLVLREQPWIDRPIFFVAVVASILASLAVDVIAMTRIRLPYASDVKLPGEEDDSPTDLATDS